MIITEDVMVFKRFYLFFLLIMSLVISGCSGWGYVFDKVFYAGQFGQRVQVPTFGIFPFGFDATESGDIYFSLQTDSTLSICKINHDSDIIYELIKTEYEAFLPRLSNNEEFILYMNGLVFGPTTLSIYNLKTKESKQLIDNYKMSPSGFIFSPDDNEIYFKGNGIGLISREYGLSKKRTDLMLKWQYEKEGQLCIQNVVIELKIVHQKLNYQKVLNEALEQTAGYAKICGVKEANILIFDRDKSQNWSADEPNEIIEHEGITLELWKLGNAEW